MAQVFSPNVKKDDSLDTIIGGLSVYSTFQDIQDKANKKEAEEKQPQSMTAMERKKVEIENYLNQQSNSYSSERYPYDGSYYY